MKKYIVFLLIVLSLVVAFFWLFAEILAPFFIGLFASYALRPFFLQLKGWGVSENLASFICTFLLFVCLMLMVLLGLPILAGEIAKFVSSLPTIFSTMEEWLSYIEHYFVVISSRLEIDVIATVRENLASNLRILLASILNVAGGVSDFLSFVGLLFLSPLVCFYFLRDWDKITASVQAQCPSRMKAGLEDFLDGIDKRMSGFFRGQLSVCALLGLFYGIGLMLLGVNFGFLLGLLTGFLAVLPYVGMVIGFSLTLLIALMQYYVAGGGVLLPLIAIVALFVAGQLIESFWLSPRLVGGEIGLHPLWFIFALLGGGLLAGLFGILVAPPVTIIVVEGIGRVLAYYHQSEFYRARE